MIGDSLNKLTAGITDKFKQIDIRGIRVFKGDFIAFKYSDKIMRVGYVVRINERSVSCHTLDKFNTTIAVPAKQFIVITELITDEERARFNKVIDEYNTHKANEIHNKLFSGVYHKANGECGFINFSVEYIGKLSKNVYDTWKKSHAKLLKLADIWLINKDKKFVHIDQIKYSQILFASYTDTIIDEFCPVNNDTSLYDAELKNTWYETNTSRTKLHLLVPIQYRYKKYGNAYFAKINNKEYFTSGTSYWPSIVGPNNTLDYIDEWNSWIKQNLFDTKYLKGDLHD
jgi:hypothetical protein